MFKTSVPDWVEQSRRLGGLLIGVASQSGRPISLAQEWAPIAAELLNIHADEVRAIEMAEKTGVARWGSEKRKGAAGASSEELSVGRRLAASVKKAFFAGQGGEAIEK